MWSRNISFCLSSLGCSHLRCQERSSMDRFAFVQHLFSSRTGISAEFCIVTASPWVLPSCFVLVLDSEVVSSAGRKLLRCLPEWQPLSKISQQNLESDCSLLGNMIKSTDFNSACVCVRVSLHPCKASGEWQVTLVLSSTKLIFKAWLFITPGASTSLCWHQWFIVVSFTPRGKWGGNACCLTSAAKLISFLRYLFGKEVETWS